jgi:amino acid adenylation domain-containing protein
VTTTTLHGLFEDQVAAWPDRIALTDGDRQLSYSDLDARAEALAGRLRTAGMVPGDLVATCLARSAEMVVSILAILKAGCAYVPLDPDYPEQRLEFLLEDSEAVAIVTDSTRVENLATGHCGVVRIDMGGGDTVRRDRAAETPAGLAYVIYTSGSTGTPKGVAVTHANVLALMAATAPLVSIESIDVWSLFHSASFDFSVWEMWGALLHGGRLVIVGNAHTKSLEAFVQLLQDEQVTILNQVPSVFRHLVAAYERLGCPRLALRTVIFGGEALDPTSVARFWRLCCGTRVRMVNMYGITETTVHVTFCDLTDELLARARNGTPIGRPLPHLAVHLMDEEGRPVPDGEPGEMWVSGAGVAQGYLGKPELTASRFRADDGMSVVSYRSGDLARREPDGSLSYLGRIDHQVKVRGFRIEPAEVESVIMEYSGVTGAVVVAHESPQGHRRLVAYVEADGGPTEKSMREFVAEQLPAHMTPAQFIVVPRLPTTANGKLDRRALPDPDSHDSGPAPAAVETPLERMLVEVWADVLGLEPDTVGVDQNFFVRGGDSLNSIQISVAVAERGQTVTLEQIFRYQTVRELAAVMAAQPREEGPKPLDRLAFALLQDADRQHLAADIVDAYPMTMLQQGMLIESALGAISGRYHDILLARINLPLVRERLDQAFADLTAAHPTLRTSFDIESHAEPLGLVWATSLLRVQVVDLTGLDTALQDAGVARWLEGERARPISWQAPPLMRAVAFAIDRDSFRLAVAKHHAILDGYSFATMLGELLRRYADRLRHGTAEPLPAEPIPFAEYVARERAAIADAQERAWWLERLKGYLPLLPAGVDLAVLWHRRRVVHLDSEICRRLRAAAAQSQISVKNVVLSAHLWVLGQVFGRADVATGLVTNGRPADAAALELLGLFLNTIPLRLELRQNSWLDLLREVAAAEVQTQTHRMYPYAQLVRDTGTTPVQISFNFIRYEEYARLESEGLPLLIEDFHVQTEFPFSLYAEVDPITEDLSLDIRVDGDRWDDDQANHMAELYRQALTAIADDVYAACPPAERAGVADAAAALGVAPERIVAVDTLTATQRDLYLDHARSTEAAPYFLAFHVTLGDRLRPDVWRQAVAEVVRREEGLRVRLWESEDGTPRICVLAGGGDAPQQIEVHAIGDLIGDLLERVRQPYALTGAELVRHYLARDELGIYHAVLVAHHIALDGVSGAIVLRRMVEAYDTLLANRPVARAQRTFRDYAPTVDARIDEQSTLDFWRDKAAHVVPLVMPKLADGLPQRTVEHAMLTRHEVAKLQAWCDRQSVRLPKLILSAYLAVLGRVCEPEAPFVVDHVVANRPAEHRETVGCFYRVAPVIASYGDTIDRASWVLDVEADRTSRKRISVLAQRSIFPKSPVRFVYNYYTFTELPDSRRMHLVDSEPPDEAHLVVEVIDGELHLSFRYRRDRLASFFLPGLVARAAMALIEPGTVGSMSLVSDGEERELLRLGDGGPALDGGGRLLHELVFEQAARMPEPEAVRIGDAALSYRDLAHRADRLAARLQELGVDAESRVAVALPRSLDLVVSLLAVLRAGGAYVPLDTGYPRERLAYMLADSGASVVLADSGFDMPLPEGVVRCAPDEEAGDFRPGFTDQRQLAYMIYTSGSTGWPKGAMNQHGAIVNRLEWMRRELAVTATDRILQKTPYSFDVSVWEFFLPLLTGARMVLAEPGRHGDPQYLTHLIESAGVTVVHFVPSMLGQFLEALEPGRCAGLRCVVSSGEALTPQLRNRFRRLLPHARLINLYGPTEAAVDVTCHECRDEVDSSVPIGRPIAGTRAYILDKTLRLVPRGATGELCVGGVQVGRGYGGRPDLTADRFVPDGFAEGLGGRLYRTGDRVRWLPNGELEYLGRNDDQVKLRGFRIELDEVTSVLRDLAEIDHAAVLLWDAPSGSPMLVAYLVPAKGAAVDWPAIAQRLRQRLPEHSVPTGHVLLDAMPLAPNGKVNRAALLAMEPQLQRNREAVCTSSTSTEEKVSLVWRELLHLDVFGVEENFFDLGGDSLLLLRTLGRVRTLVDVASSLSVVDLFSHPTVRALAAHLDRLTGAAAGSESTGTRRSGRSETVAAQRERRLARRRSP